MFAVFFVSTSVAAIVGAVVFVAWRENKRASEFDDALLLAEALGVVRDMPVSESAPLVASATPIYDELAVARLRRDLDAWGNSDGAA